MSASYSPGFFSDIDGRVLIAVMVTATFRAIPFPYSQVFCFIVLVATDMAQLAAGIPLVYLDKLFALPSQLILQHVREHIPAIVSYGFAKAELTALFPLGHRLDADILNANSVIAVCKAAGLLMQEIPALIGHFLMENSYTQPLFLPVMTSLLLFG